MAREPAGSWEALGPPGYNSQPFPGRSADQPAFKSPMRMWQAVAYVKFTSADTAQEDADVSQPPPSPPPSRL